MYRMIKMCSYRSQVKTKSGRIRYDTSKLTGEDLFRTSNITWRDSYHAIEEEKEPVVGGEG